MIAGEVNMNRETVRLILTEELGMRKICAKMVPRNLRQQQRDSRLIAVSNIQMHYDDAAASLITWSHILRILCISKSKIGSERTPFWVNRRHPELCNAGLRQHPTKCVPGMLQTMAAPLEKVCTRTRDVLWRLPNCTWWINTIKLFFWHHSHYFIVRPRMSYSLLANCRQTCMTYTIAVYTAKNSWRWTEELPETCRVLFQK